ncbi:MAG: diacylglycerol kinase family protein [Bacteroidales bacterium]
MAFLRKLRDAFSGLGYFIGHVSNARIHLVLTAFVIAAGIYFSLSFLEWVAITLCIGGVFVAEILNTALEQLCDLYTREENNKIGKVKDLAASAVLFMSFISVIVAAIIFLPKIMKMF